MFFKLLALLTLLSCCNNQELQCGSHQNGDAPLCSGDIITSTCSIQDTVVIWIIQTEEVVYQIDFNAINNIGDRESDGPFSAILTKHYPSPDTVSESVLQYTLSEKLNGSKVECLHLNNESLTKSCVIANTETLPGHVNDVSTVHTSCLSTSVSWSEPDIGLSTLRHYLLTLDPPTGGIQEYRVSGTQFDIIDLEYGINYDLSISACNCIACGPIVSKSVAIDMTKEELMQHLNIDSSSISYTVVEGFNGYDFLFEWGDTSPSCVLTYSVNITYENNTRTTYNTIHTNYSSSSHIRGSKFIVSVAGVNGNVTGPYTPEMCLEIEVPGNADVTSKNITKERFGHFLEIIWEPPVTLCRRPSVERYIINYDFQSYESENTRFSIILRSTKNRQANLNVTIIPVNVIGQGISTTVSVPFPNSATTGTQPSVFIAIVIGLLLTILLNT